METFFFSSFIALEIDKGYCELKVFRFILLLGIASMLFLLNGCNDTPNSVGRGSQNKEDFGVVHVDTLYATDHASTQNLIYTSSIDRFMLGKYKTYQAWTCLKFYGWPDSLIGKKITSATIRLKGVYHFGDSLAPLSFDAYRAMSNLFLTDSLTYDSLNLNSVNSVHGVYYNSSPLSIPTIFPVGDTGSMTIHILDTTMLREWFSTNTDTTDLNDGLLFRPTNSNIIKGFYSFNASDTSYQPTLYITYQDTNGNTVGYSHKVGISKYVSTVNQASLIMDNTLIYVQNGISYRGFVSFDSISTPWPASVYRAVLQVTLNVPQSSAQFTPFAHDSLYALSVGTNDKSDGGAYGMSQLSTDSSGHPFYSFEIRQIAVRMLNNASIRKIALSGYSESGSFDLHALYGALSDKKLKPRLIITYSIQR
ncbi:MAG: hypothetical protein NTX44_06850 [Ignavibacteriales bacterium]|nr:hypothetical protein [Ignavibacteriales bacterium]